MTQWSSTRRELLMSPLLNQFSCQANKPNALVSFLNNSDCPNSLLVLCKSLRVACLERTRTLRLRLSPWGLRKGRRPRSWRECRSPRCPQTPPGTSWRWWARSPPCAAPSGREASAASRSSGPWTPAGPPAATQSTESEEESRRRIDHWSAPYWMIQCRTAGIDFFFFFFFK